MYFSYTINDVKREDMNITNGAVIDKVCRVPKNKEYVVPHKMGNKKELMFCQVAKHAIL